jgi:hypothetical protein
MIVAFMLIPAKVGKSLGDTERFKVHVNGLFYRNVKVSL